MFGHTVNIILCLVVACLVFLLYFFSSHQLVQYSVDQFLDTKRYSSGVFSHDERRVFFSSDEGGEFNVYSISREGEDLRQHTFLKGRSAFMLCDLPHDMGFLYSSDGGGDELFHIFLCRRDGTTQDLTPYPGAQSRFHSMSHDEKSFFFISNRRDPNCMDLYEMDLAALLPRQIFQNTGEFEIEHISSDKRFLSLKKTRSWNAIDLYLFDLEKKELVNLSPTSGDIINTSCCFSPDSKTLYFLSDEGSDFTYVKSYSIESKKFEIVRKADWDIVDYRLSPDGKYSLQVINEDAAFRVELFDPFHREVELPKLPNGAITNVLFSKNSDRLLLEVRGDRTPLEYYCYDRKEKSSSCLTPAFGADVDVRNLVDSERVRFSSYDGMKIPALYYKPRDLQKRAAIIWVHGGPNIQSMQWYNPTIQFLVNHGYAVLAVNHRGSIGYGKTFLRASDHQAGKADLDDCIWAKKFLLTTGDFDENKIGIAGESFGGYMVLAALAFRPDEMALGVDIYGVANWLRTLKSLPSWNATRRDAFYKRIGNPETEVAYLESISPLFHASSIKKPLLVVQGTNDVRVLKIESDQIVDEVRKNGVPCEYLLIQDEGHGFLNKESEKKVLQTMLDFLNKNL
jgi:acetyl esterase/lipase/Tol biopolymer transport system component